MYKDIIAQRKRDFDMAFEFVRTEIASVRTGRANSSLVEDIQVEYMGSRTRVKELGTILTPEPRVIFIQPWDKTVIPAIEKAIRDQAAGLGVSSDSTGVRATVPSLTEDRRKELLRLVSQKIEEGRIKVRQVREDILKRVQAEVKAKTAREDDLHRAKDEVQKIIDNLNKQFDELHKKKEQELMNS